MFDRWAYVRDVESHFIRATGIMRGSLLGEVRRLAECAADAHEQSISLCSSDAPPKPKGRGCSLCKRGVEVHPTGMCQKCNSRCVAMSRSQKTHTYADGTRKPRMELLPLDVLKHVANAFEAGLKNGRKVDEWRRLPASAAPEYLGAAMRHIEAMQRGECFDPDAPHVPHFAAAIASLCIWGFHEFRKAGA